MPKKLNANQKGKRFEREVVKRFNTRFGTDCRRTPNSGGLSIKGDIIDLSGPLSSFNFECKNQESMSIWKCMEQTERQSGGKMGALVFTKNNHPNYVCMDMEDWMDLVWDAYGDDDE